MHLPIDPDALKGFLAPDEGARLFDLASEVAPRGPCLEVGSYCGKSTVYLGSACQQAGQILFAVDHHRGSEEHQLGEEYHDPELFDAGAGVMDSFREFRQNVDRAALGDCVVPIVATSELVGRHWQTPLSLVFIDGGHSEAAALADYRNWAPHVMAGGILAIHDLFENPEEGGQAPFNIYKMARSSGLFETLPTTRTLGVLRRIR